MKYSIRGDDPAGRKTGMLCAFVSDGVDLPDSLISRIDRTPESAILPGGRTDSYGLGVPGGKIKEMLRATPKAGKTSVIGTLGLLPAEYVLVGRLDGRSPDPIRRMAATAARKAVEYGVDELAVVVPGGVPGAAGEIVEGAKLGAYRFDRFKTGKREGVPDLVLLAPESGENASRARAAEIAADGVMLAMDLANMPPNACAPADLAEEARKALEGSGVSVDVMRDGSLAGFGGIRAVGQGSGNPPRLIVMEYRGGGDARPVVIVGKAVTFDTGGISIKPSAKLEEMKFDKCGGCAVLGVMKAASALGLPVNVVGIVPAVENMPGGGSYRPGDIITLYGGTTAEIVNTDAEGRLILADALAYGRERYDPEAMIDLATLTGACVVALGNNVAGLVSNDDSLANGLLESSARTAEEIWRLPINYEYSDMIKSEVADVRNVGIGRAAGAITAAAFLERAAGDTPWAHLDIAGVAWVQEATAHRPYARDGATGFGVRLILDYLAGR